MAKFSATCDRASAIMEDIQQGIVDEEDWLGQKVQEVIKDGHKEGEQENDAADTQIELEGSGEMAAMPVSETDGKQD